MRVTLSAPVNPSSGSRAETPARWWKWRVDFSFGWKASEHINALECRAALASLRWRCRQRRLFGHRVVHLLDSSVVIGCLTRRRSTSYRLAPLVKRTNALELATGIISTYGFTRSSHNPADKPSRHIRVRKKTKHAFTRVATPPDARL